MKKLINILSSKWNNRKKWFQISFVYPYKKNYNKIESFMPLHLNVRQGVIVEKNVEISNSVKELGKYVYIANSTYIGFCSRIGSFTSISFGVKIGLRNHPVDFVSTSPVFYAKRRGWVAENRFNELEDGMVEIGNDVLISANVVILSGVKIGDGAVIAAGAIVNKDVPPYSVIGGVPAKLIRYRFDEGTREKLLKSRWWDFEDSQLKEVAKDINNSVAFLAHFK